MEIKVKPYEPGYANQCADLLQYLWKEDKSGRVARFEWAYLNNPNASGKVMSVIAVNKNDEVMGFRGYIMNRFIINGHTTLVAQLSDTVVSAKARRMGIFQRMTDYSLQYLRDNGVEMILNLTPSWPPYYGYKKLGFADVCQFRSKYYINAFRILRDRIIHTKCTTTINRTRECNNITCHINAVVPDYVLRQFQPSSCSRLDSIKDEKPLRWKASHPGAKYCYAWAETPESHLLSFLWFKTNDFRNYNLGLFYSKDDKVTRKLFLFFKSQIRPTTVAVWSFAKSAKDNKLLHSLGLFEIPFINKIRHNPPVIVKSLKNDTQGNTDWTFGGLDIRKAENWNIDKFDADSF